MTWLDAMGIVAGASWVILHFYAFKHEKHPFWSAFLDITTFRALWVRR